MCCQQRCQKKTKLNTYKRSLTPEKLRTQTSSSTVWRNCIANICSKISTSSFYRQARKWSIKRKFNKKWSIKPTLAGKLADIIVFMADKEEIRTEQLVAQLGLTETTAKRYLRQLTEFGYLEAHGGNRNKSYKRKWKNKKFLFKARFLAMAELNRFSSAHLA